MYSLHRGRRAVVPSLLAALALFAAGCTSDGGSDEEEATPTTSSAPAEPTAEPTAESTDLPPSDAVDGPSDDGGLPGWVPPVLVVVLLGVAGAVAVVRRRR